MDTMVYIVSVFDSFADCTDVLGVYSKLEYAILDVCASAQLLGCDGVSQVEPQDAIGLTYEMIGHNRSTEDIFIYRIERMRVDGLFGSTL